jgi:hypothetical protein
MMKRQRWNKVAGYFLVLGMMWGGGVVGCDGGDEASSELEASTGTTDEQEPVDETLEQDQEVEPVVVDTPFLAVADVIAFTHELEPGVIEGYNLDGLISEDGSDDAGCGHADFTSPDGEEGIDNQFGKMSALFDFVGIGAFEDFVQQTIEDGGLLLMWQMDDVDDPDNDEEVTVTYRYGQGTPLLGTDGRLLAGQTFHAHEESPDQLLGNARLEDGVLYAGPFDIRIPAVVFGILYELNVINGYLQARPTYDGGFEEGLLVGGVAITDVLEMATKANLQDSSILETVEMLIDGMGDLKPDGNGDCQQISAAFNFSAVSAFLYLTEEEASEDDEGE